MFALSGDEVALLAQSIVLGADSQLSLAGNAVELDAETVTVGSTSVLEVSAPEAVLNISHLELAGPNGPKSFQPASYYAPFAPGGTFKIGAPTQEIEGADDDDEAGESRRGRGRRGRRGR